MDFDSTITKFIDFFYYKFSIGKIKMFQNNIKYRNNEIRINNINNNIDLRILIITYKNIYKNKVMMKI